MEAIGPPSQHEAQEEGKHKRRTQTHTAGYARVMQHNDDTKYANADHIHHAYAVSNETTGEQLEFRQLIRHPKHWLTWLPSAVNEFGRLAQGVGGRVEGTDTMFFIYKHQVPQGRKVTYPKVVCTIRPEKEETHHTRITADGNLLEYHGDFSTETASLETVKIHLNSTISTKNGRYMCMDAGNFYLNTPLDIREYMRFPVWMIPDEIMDAYNLHDKVLDGYVYVELHKAVYQLKQAGKLANDLLKKWLAADGYRPTEYTPGLWKHDNKPILSTLVVDDFGVKYVNKADAEHLETCLSKHCRMKSDWTGGRYVGIYLNRDYKNRTVKLTMPNYVKNALDQSQHTQPKQQVYSPSKYTAPQYGVKVQLTNAIDTSP
jgi:hypothetical protein